MLRKLIIHPFLFALSPIVFLVGYNIESMSDFASAALYTVVLFLSAITLGLTVLLFTLLSLIIRDRHRVGVALFSFLVFFFSYGQVYGLIKYWQIGDITIGRHRYLFPLWTIGIIVVVFIFKRVQVDFIKYTKRLTITSCAILTFSLLQIGVGFYQSQDNSRALLNPKNWIKDEQISKKTLGEDAAMPDIYYIISDENASAITLREVFGYDNSQFTEFLKNKGFYVAEESHSNYPVTSWSIPSSLNMQYLNLPTDIAKNNFPRDQILLEMLRHNQVIHNLKSIGYKYVYISSSRVNGYADANVALGKAGILESKFALAFIRQTMLYPILTDYLVSLQANRERRLFSVISGAVDEIEGPKFVFAHILLPHPPFVFEADGNIRKRAGFFFFWGMSGLKEAYLEQVKYTNKMLQQLVEEILQKSERPPIIVLQSDHGPQTTLVVDTFGNWNSQPTPEMLQERFRILNAYYFSSGGKELLYDSISPVNTFRIIFNRYFGMHYDLLEDKGFFLPNKLYPPQEVNFKAL